MDWGEIFYWTAFFLAGLVLLSMAAGVIANAVIKTKRANAFVVELSVTSLSGHEGKVTARFDTAGQAQTFVSDWQAATGWARVGRE